MKFQDRRLTRSARTEPSFTGMLYILATVLIAIGPAIDSVLAETQPTATPLFSLRAGHIWGVHVHKPDHFQLLHHAPNAEPEALYVALESSGSPTHIAATDDHVYVVYTDQTIQMLHYYRSREFPTYLYKPYITPPIPVSGKILDVVATSRGIAVLLRNEEYSVEAKENRQSIESQLAEESTDGPYRLVKLTQRRWESIPLPTVIDPDSNLHLVCTDIATDHLQLVEVDPDRITITIHDRNKTGWLSPLQEFETTDATRFVGAINQLFAFGSSHTDELAISLIRPDTVTPIGSISPPSSSDQPWTLLPHDNRLAIVVADAAAWRWTELDPSQAITSDPEFNKLEIQAIPPIAVNTRMLILSVSLVLATLFLLTSWRNNPQANRVELPKDVHPAAARHRILAGIIDLFPAIFITAAIYGDSEFEILVNEAMAQNSEPPMGPFLLTIGINFLHTFISESLTGYSLGKWLMGCRVADNHGQRPKIRAIFLRNLVRPLEVMAPLLLILLVVSPYRQRLGDLIGRTTVIRVTPNRPPPSAPQD